jgi:hypothetical protein
VGDGAVPGVDVDTIGDLAPPELGGMAPPEHRLLRITSLIGSDRVVVGLSELEQIEIGQCGVESVAAGVAGDLPGGQPPFEHADRVLDLFACRCRRAEGPDHVHQAAHGDRAVGIEQQTCEDRALPSTSDRHRFPARAAAHP